MKFDKFIKNAVPFCKTVLTEKWGNWVQDGRVFMKVPRGLESYGFAVQKDELLNDALNLYDTDEIYEFAELVEAKLPREDSKPSAVIRVFADTENSMNIPNKIYQLIESTDKIVIMVDEDLRPIMFVGKMCDSVDDFEPHMIIFEEE